MAPPQLAASALLLQIVIASSTLLLLVLISSAVIPSPIGLENCITTCGVVDVPLLGHPQLLLGGGLRVIDISVAYHSVTVAHTGGSVNNITSSAVGPPLPAHYYMLSSRNELVLIGCNVQVMLVGSQGDDTEQIIGGCASFCSDADSKFKWFSSAPGFCSGIGCCWAAISDSSKHWGALYWQFDLNTSRVPAIGKAEREPAGALMFVAREGWFKMMAKYLGPSPTTAGLELPVALDWSVPVNDDLVDGEHCSNRTARSVCRSSNSTCRIAIGGAMCECETGYEGNPYIEDGCYG
nr:unnamed protein product [Digitaria exilis]